MSDNICTEHDEKMSAKVIDIQNDLVLVEVLENTGCSSCPMSGCAASKTTGKPIWAKNAIGVSVGDNVIITRSGGSHLLGAFLMFLVPVIILVASLLILQSLVEYNPAILLSVLTVGIYYAIGKFTGFFKRAGNKWAYSVLSVVPKLDK